MPEQLSRVTFRKATRIPVGRDQLLHMIESSISPLALSLSLWVVAFWSDTYVAPRYVILSLIVFSLTFPGSALMTEPLGSVFRRIMVGWFAITASCSSSATRAAT